MSDEGKLYVGNLSYDTSEDTLAAAFGKYGSIEKVDVIRDRETGRPRGFAFVKYDNPDDAKDAISGMDGTTIDGRQVRVSPAGSGGRGRGGFGSRGRGGRGYARGGGGYNGDRGYGERSYGDRSFGNSERSYGGGGGGGGYRSGGYSSGGGYRGNRGQGGYSERSATYRDGYDSYASHE